MRSVSSENDDEEKQDLIVNDSSNYKEQSWRFVNLVVFVLACCVNSLPAHTFTTINKIVKDLYDTQKIVVSFNTLLFPVSHPILAFVANWILDKYGLRIGCSIGMILLATGVWLRVLINQSMVATIIGSALAATGNIFIINSPSKMASTWFRPAISPRVTTLGVMANMASIGFGVVLPSIFVTKTSSKNDVKNMLMWEAIIVSIPAILLVALLKNKPKQPPSFAAAIKNKNDYKSDLLSLLKNKNYIILFISVSLSYGSLTCFTTCIQYIASPFFQNHEKISANMLVFAMIAGFISSVVFVILLKKSFAYKKILISAMIGTVFQLIILIFTFDAKRQWLIYFVIGCTGFFFIPQIAIFLQLGCELAFPVGQASSSGFLLAGGQLTGFLTGLLGIEFLEEDSKWEVYIVVGCVCLMVFSGSILMLFLYQDLRKINYEKSKSEVSERTL